MAAQDVREALPRIRRAIEGPVPAVGSESLSDTQLLAWTADAIADIILITVGRWPHVLVVAERDSANVPTEWAVDPELLPEEESLVASQAALTYFFHQLKDMKVSERIRNEGQEWEWQKSATLLRDQFKLLIEQRDKALASLVERYPVLARYASILEVRDRLASAVLEPYVHGGGLGGGQELVNWAPVWW